MPISELDWTSPSSTPYGFFFISSNHFQKHQHITMYELYLIIHSKKRGFICWRSQLNLANVLKNKTEKHKTSAIATAYIFLNVLLLWFNLFIFLEKRVVYTCCVKVYSLVEMDKSIAAIWRVYRNEPWNWKWANLFIFFNSCNISR